MLDATLNGNHSESNYNSHLSIPKSNYIYFCSSCNHNIDASYMKHKINMLYITYKF